MPSFEEIKNIEKKWRERWEEREIFKADVKKKKKKFFLTFPYPYVNGAPHIGHSYTFFRIDSYARFKRLQGYNVLFPQSFHATGEPILGAIERIKDGDKTQIETFKLFGATDEDIKSFVENGAEYVARYWMKRWIEDLKLAGMSVDWRRTFVTAITPIYNKFIEWQYRTLKNRGYVVQGTHPVIWCPKCQSPTGDHDRLKGEGESPIEFYIIKFKLESGEVLPCATLRPETIYGVTNIWVKPFSKYLKVKVGEEIWIISERAKIKLSDQLKKVENLGEIYSQDLIGKTAINLLNGEKIPILPAEFVDLDTGTGVVMSVPAHAPYDYIALKDLGRSGVIGGIEPRVIISIQDFMGIPAKEVCEKYGILSQLDKEKLDSATQEVYKKEFHKGVMIVEELKNIPVSKAKGIVVEKLKSLGLLDSMWEPSGEVICRCKAKCHVKILENQWFLKYSDEEWKKKVKEALSKMKIYPEEIREQFLNTIDWLENKACTRKTGLGTKLPWDQEWIVETLSDSTIYMALYTIYHLIKDLEAEKIKDSFFDYIFLGKGELNSVAKENGVKKDLLRKAREEFEYFYPVDFRGSGKDLVQNHLTFYIFHHVAIWENEKYWPRMIGVNGFVNVAGEKMSKSKGNIIPLRNLINTYGSDLVRINIISSAEDLNDADWRFENLEVFLGRINFVFNLLKNIENMKRRKEKIFDRIILNYILRNVREAEKAYEELKFRTATQLLIFNTLNKLEEYFRRIGGVENGNRKIVRKILEVWVRAVSPLLPHLSEEFWEMLGKKKFVFECEYPSEREDESYIIMGDFLEEVFEDVREIIKIREIRPKEIYLIIASEWKFNLYEKFLNQVQPKIEEFLQQFSTRESKELAAKFYKKVEEIVKRKEARKVVERDMQLSLLKECVELFEREFGCKVIVESEEESKFEKKFNAAPFKPAIYILEQS